MTLPNKLTILRIILIPIFVVLFFLPFDGLKFAALGVFVLASLTDMLDGYLARKLKQITTLGKFLDPIADKMLVVSALILVCVNFAMNIYDSITLAFTIIVSVCTIAIICRELTVNAIRMIVASKGVVIAADKMGKVKTVMQIAALLVLIPIYDMVPIGNDVWQVLVYIGSGILTVATIITLISGINYIVKNKAALRDDDKEEMIKKMTNDK